MQVRRNFQQYYLWDFDACKNLMTVGCSKLLELSVFSTLGVDDLSPLPSWGSSFWIGGFHFVFPGWLSLSGALGALVRFARAGGLILRFCSAQIWKWLFPSLTFNLPSWAVWPMEYLWDAYWKPFRKDWISGWWCIIGESLRNFQGFEGFKQFYVPPSHTMLILKPGYTFWIPPLLISSTLPQSKKLPRNFKLTSLSLHQCSIGSPLSTLMPMDGSQFMRFQAMLIYKGSVSAFCLP